MTTGRNQPRPEILQILELLLAEKKAKTSPPACRIPREHQGTFSDLGNFFSKTMINLLLLRVGDS
jgi:hypothetical protein